MGIPVGKLSLYTALGGVRPSACAIVCGATAGRTRKRRAADSTAVTSSCLRRTRFLLLAPAPESPLDSWVQRDGLAPGFGRLSRRRESGEVEVAGAMAAMAPCFLSVSAAHSNQTPAVTPWSSSRTAIAMMRQTWRTTRPWRCSATGTGTPSCLLLKMRDARPLVPFKVERKEEDTRVETYCATKPGLLLSMVSTLDTLGLDIQQCVVSCFNDFAMHASCAEVISVNPDEWTDQEVNCLANSGGKI